MRRHFALVVALLALAVRSLDGTAIVAFRTSTRIVLAADEMFREPGRPPLLACKLRRLGTLWTLVGGYMTHPGADRDVFDLLAPLVTPARSVPAALAAIEASSDLRAALHNAARFSQPTEGFTGLSVTVAEPATLTIGTCGFLHGGGGVLCGKCPGAWCESPGVVFFGASVDGPLVPMLAARPRAPWLAAGDVAAARRLIRMQVDVAPDRVGGPIDILEISRAGARWIDRDPASRCH